MFERLTQPAREVVTRADALAAEDAASELRPEHLLRALLEDPAPVVARVLVDVGAPPERLRAEVESRSRRYVDGLDANDAEALATIGIDLDEVVRRIDRNLGGPLPRRRSPRFARSSKTVIELALREAVALRQGHVGAEHLLLGVARCGDRLVVDSLAVFSVGAQQLRERLTSAQLFSD